MTFEDKTALRQLAYMLKTGELYGGTIRQRAQFVVAISAALELSNTPVPCIACDAAIKDGQGVHLATMKEDRLNP